MNRRAFVTGLGAVFAAPLGAEAQPAGKVYRIGSIYSGSSRPPEARAFFMQRLGELGWIEGQNFVFETRFAEGKLVRLPVLVSDLLRLNVDVIIANDTPTAEGRERGDPDGAYRDWDR